MSAASNLKNKSRFDAEAEAWDNNPFVHARSAEAWNSIQKVVPIFSKDRDISGQSSSMPDVLEIGCGTGLLSLLVAPRANTLVAVDAADGMIKVLKKKLSQPDAPTNIVPLCVLLQDAEDPALPLADESKPDGLRLKFDLITSHLVLHHIPELAPVLQTMLDCLKPGGMVALTDFEDFGPEAKRFHPESRMEGVERHGINKTWMEELMTAVGFVNVKVEVGWQAEKRVERYPGEFANKSDGWNKEKGESMTFPFLVCLGCKPSI